MSRWTMHTAAVSKWGMASTLPHVNTGQIKAAFLADIHPFSRLVRLYQVHLKFLIRIVTDRAGMAVDTPVMAA